MILEDNIEIFSGQIFDICPHLASRDLQSLGVTRSPPAVPYGAYFYKLHYLCAADYSIHMIA